MANPYPFLPQLVEETDRRTLCDDTDVLDIIVAKMNNLLYDYLISYKIDNHLYLLPVDLVDTIIDVCNKEIIYSCGVDMYLQYKDENRIDDIKNNLLVNDKYKFFMEKMLEEVKEYCIAYESMIIE